MLHLATPRTWQYASHCILWGNLPSIQNKLWRRISMAWLLVTTTKTIRYNAPTISNQITWQIFCHFYVPLGKPLLCHQTQSVHSRTNRGNLRIVHLFHLSENRELDLPSCSRSEESPYEPSPGGHSAYSKMHAGKEAECNVILTHFRYWGKKISTERKNGFAIYENGRQL